MKGDDYCSASGTNAIFLPQNKDERKKLLHQEEEIEEKKPKISKKVLKKLEQLEVCIIFVY